MGAIVSLQQSDTAKQYLAPIMHQSAYTPQKSACIYSFYDSSERGKGGMRFDGNYGSAPAYVLEGGGRV